MPSNVVNIVGRRANGQPVAVRCDNVGRIEIIGGGGAGVVVIQPNPDLLNVNANMQVGDVDASNANPVPVSDAGGSLTVDQATHDLLNGNANMQVGDVDVANGNPVPVSDAGGTLTVDQATHDLLNANANVQVGDVDVANGNPIPVSDAGGSLTVDIGAGENHIGQVGSEGDTIAQIPTITAGAYAAGDAVGGLLTFANAARLAGGGGVIKTVVIIDDAGQDAGLQLWLFNQTFVAMVDNAPWAPAEADLENLVGVVTTDDSAQGWLAAGTPSAVTIDVATRYDVTGTSLFGQLVTPVSTPTYVATDDLTVKVGLLQD